VVKLLGDCVLAYFPTDCAVKVVEMCIAVGQELEALRKKDEKLFSLLYVGFGVSSGRLFEGPVGSDQSKDFALIGRTQTLAFQAEAATRRAGCSVVVHQDFRTVCQTCQADLPWEFVPLEKQDEAEGGQEEEEEEEGEGMVRVVCAETSWNVEEIKKEQNRILKTLAPMVGSEPSQVAPTTTPTTLEEKSESSGSISPWAVAALVVLTVTAIGFWFKTREEDGSAM
jgi:hypothetical protein